MNYKEQYNQLLKPYFENGLLTEIYSDQKISICNMANTSYVVFMYNTLEYGKENFSGIMFHGMALESVVTNPEILYNEFLKMDSADRRDLIVPINNRAFEIMKQMKKKTDVVGPTSDINLKMEQELMAKNKSR